MIRVGTIVVLLATAACGRSGGGANAVLDSYSRALEKRDFDAAYSLMSEEYRAQHSRSEFEALLARNDKEVTETARRMRDDEVRVEIYANIEYGLDDRLRLVHEGGKWKIATNPAKFYSHSSPREALRSFVRAYRGRRWAVMLRYVPKAYRERMTADVVKEQFDGERREEMAEMMSSIAAHLDAPIEIQGSSARMAYAKKYEVVFRREKDGWKIADLD